MPSSLLASTNPLPPPAAARGVPLRPLPPGSTLACHPDSPAARAVEAADAMGVWLPEGGRALCAATGGAKRPRHPLPPVMKIGHPGPDPRLPRSMRPRPDPPNRKKAVCVVREGGMGEGGRGDEERSTGEEFRTLSPYYIFDHHVRHGGLRAYF